jgi:ssDNA-binding Zn-finger/Zn-ribbon topoisomerase 1
MTYDKCKKCGGEIGDQFDLDENFWIPINWCQCEKTILEKEVEEYEKKYITK